MHSIIFTTTTITFAILLLLLLVSTAEKEAAAETLRGVPPLPPAESPCVQHPNSTVQGQKAMASVPSKYPSACCWNCTRNNLCWASSFDGKMCHYFRRGFKLVPKRGGQATTISPNFFCSKYPGQGDLCSRSQECCIGDEGQQGSCFSPANGTCCAGIISAQVCSKSGGCCMWGQGASSGQMCCAPKTTCCSYQLSGFCCKEGFTCCSQGNGGPYAACCSPTEKCDYGQLKCVPKTTKTP